MRLLLCGMTLERDSRDKSSLTDRDNVKGGPDRVNIILVPPLADKTYAQTLYVI